MIWDIQEQTFENKGMISGLHSRAIYSCSWSKGQVKVADSPDIELDLIATVRFDVHWFYFQAGADNKIMVYDVNRESLSNHGSSSFEFNIVAQKVINFLVAHFFA